MFDIYLEKSEKLHVSPRYWHILKVIDNSLVSVKIEETVFPPLCSLASFVVD